MYKKTVIKNESTEFFYDLAERSFDASWKCMQAACNEDISHLVDDADFIIPFMKQVMAHIYKNFNVFSKQEGNTGDLNEVNLEEISARLVRHSWIFCK
ncbi:TPA: hypothetical protein ACLMQK_004224 [Yersinia enterocolitica]|uniref:hypothetical protein n=1 Tax=Yersinia vastinensis TaxID=2890318 RepID=UPI00119ED9D7|nr:hypothetical protein [Yersinia vastinensis]EKN6007621.1 hypothetical protein [Yersinia enterocolitica]HEN3495169.1 hypothetical protein [Yersinia enterocolitica]